MQPVVNGFARRKDAGIYYEVYGNGPAVVLLHGNGETLHIFDPMLPALARSHRVIAIDTRGHGKSERGSAPFNFDTFAADTAAVLSSLKIPAATFVGYSDGASTALHLALASPGLVRGLALLGANLSPKGVERRYQLPIEFGYLVTRVLARVDRRAAHNRDQLSLMTKHPNLTTGQIAAIKAPTLVLAGERDMIKREHTESIAAAIPGAKLKILAGEDHFTLVKAPQTLEAILEFLGETP